MYSINANKHDVFPYCYKIVISGGKLKTVDVDDFKGSQNTLRVLDLVDNNFAAFPNGLLYILQAECKKVQH